MRQGVGAKSFCPDGLRKAGTREDSLGGGSRGWGGGVGGFGFGFEGGAVQEAARQFAIQVALRSLPAVDDGSQARAIGAT